MDIFELSFWDGQTISPEFRKIIDEKCEVVQSGGKLEGK